MAENFFKVVTDYAAIIPITKKKEKQKRFLKVFLV